MPMERRTYPHTKVDCTGFIFTRDDGIIYCTDCGMQMARPEWLEKERRVIKTLAELDKVWR